MGCDQCQNSLCQKAVHTSKIGYMCSDLLETGGMCCRNGGGGMYQLQKWGVCVVEMGGYVSDAEMRGMSCINGGYVLWKWGVCISCRNGG